MMLQKGVVEIDVVRYKDLILQHFKYLGSYLLKRRSMGNHRFINARKVLDEIWNRLAGVYQGFVKIKDLFAIVNNDGNFRYTVSGGITSRGFYIDYGV